MSENLKVNAKTSVLEHKRKHNLLVEEVSKNGEFISKNFIDGSVDLIGSASGITKTYGKWSLSGTHLMIVLGGSIENGTELATNVYAQCVNLPEWIVNKIMPIFSNNVTRKSTNLWADNYTSQTMNVNLIKQSTFIQIQFGQITLTAKRYFRIEFDLLID